jgi:hypothetical protein
VSRGPAADDGFSEFDDDFGGSKPKADGSGGAAKEEGEDWGF